MAMEHNCRCYTSVDAPDVVNRQSFHWGMAVSVPWLVLASASVGVLALSTLTAWASGRKAMSDEVVRAVKEDW